MIKMVKLGEACNVRRGTTITKKQTIKGNVPVIAGGKKATYFHNKHNRDSGTITVSGSGASAGLVNIWSTPIFASDCTTVEMKDNKHNEMFVYYYMLSIQEYIYKELRSGAAQPHVYAKDIANLNFPLFPLNEQERIVAELDMLSIETDRIRLSIKNKIELSKKLFNKYLESIFQNSNYKSIQIGEIPGVHSGGTPSTSNKDFWNGTIPWYTSRELNEYNTSVSVKNITELGLQNSNAKIFPKKTLLIGIYDTAAMKMSILHQKGTFNQAIVGIPPNLQFETEYLFFVLNYMKDKILLQRRGVRQMNLSLAKIKKISVPKPSIKEQRKIIHSCNIIKDQTQILEKFHLKKLTLLNSLKKSIFNQKINRNVA